MSFCASVALSVETGSVQCVCDWNEFFNALCRWSFYEAEPATDRAEGSRLGQVQFEASSAS